MGMVNVGKTTIQRHAISISYVYHLPKLQSGNSILRAVLNDWRTSGLIQHHSGEALTAYMGTDNSLTGLSQDRAQRDFSKPAYSRQNSGSGDCPAGKSCVNRSEEHTSELQSRQYLVWRLL